MTDVSSAFRTISRQMSERFRERMPAAQPQLAFTQIPKKAGDALYHVLVAMVPWESRHLPDTDAAFSAVQEARRRAIAEGLNTTPGRPHGRRRRRAAAMAVAAEVEIERAHVCMDQQQCLEQVKRWGVGFDTAFARWRIPSLNGMQTNFNVDPWEPPGGSDWGRINEDIMREINWRQWQERRRGQGPNAAFEVRVDGQVQAVITPARRDSVTISLPASARYVEIQDPERQVVVATCHLMDPHDLPRGAGGVPCHSLTAEACFSPCLHCRIRRRKRPTYAWRLRCRHPGCGGPPRAGWRNASGHGWPRGCQWRLPAGRWRARSWAWCCR
jgi:hypothetical protein